jgi:hypothetical protein
MDGDLGLRSTFKPAQHARRGLVRAFTAAYNACMQQSLRCKCGTVRGTVALEAGHGMRVVCYCADCRAFAHAIARSDVLDANGGSEIYWTTPSRMQLTAGVDQVRCLRLSEKGLFRWYAHCCNTPIANTLGNPGLPFLSILTAFVDTLDPSVLGPRRYVQTGSALGTLPPEVKPSKIIVQAIINLIGARLRGEHKPNALFAGGKPIAVPRVLPSIEREALRAQSA